MLEAIIVILVLLWALGYFVVHLGDVMHFLLLIAVIVLVYRLLKGRSQI